MCKEIKLQWKECQHMGWGGVKWCSEFPSCGGPKPQLVPNKIYEGICSDCHARACDPKNRGAGSSSAGGRPMATTKSASSGPQVDAAGSPEVRNWNDSVKQVGKDKDKEREAKERQRKREQEKAKAKDGEGEKARQRKKQKTTKTGATMMTPPEAMMTARNSHTPASTTPMPTLGPPFASSSSAASGGSSGAGSYMANLSSVGMASPATSSIGSPATTVSSGSGSSNNDRGRGSMSGALLPQSRSRSGPGTTPTPFHGHGHVHEYLRVGRASHSPFGGTTPITNNTPNNFGPGPPIASVIHPGLAPPWSEPGGGGAVTNMASMRCTAPGGTNDSALMTTTNYDMSKGMDVNTSIRMAGMTTGAPVGSQGMYHRQVDSMPTGQAGYVAQYSANPTPEHGYGNPYLIQYTSDDPSTGGINEYTQEMNYAQGYDGYDGYVHPQGGTNAGIEYSGHGYQQGYGCEQGQGGMTTQYGGHQTAASMGYVGYDADDSGGMQPPPPAAPFYRNGGRHD
ncbi:hypothetical protein MKZ38_003822 [Zalerion maritima]|uniref:Uncharacterized protein n=1 Tax=Zalerion maritima TaxID=339359 RepID=A0AAD5RMA4_9PEZI|nr:hypothetical protein MKZ38_003822 [Zalerion maritima]